MHQVKFIHFPRWHPCTSCKNITMESVSHSTSIMLETLWHIQIILWTSSTNICDTTKSKLVFTSLSGQANHVHACQTQCKTKTQMRYIPNQTAFRPTCDFSSSQNLETSKSLSCYLGHSWRYCLPQDLPPFFQRMFQKRQSWTSHVALTSPLWLVPGSLGCSAGCPDGKYWGVQVWGSHQVSAHLLQPSWFHVVFWSLTFDPRSYSLSRTWSIVAEAQPHRQSDSLVS